VPGHAGPDGWPTHVRAPAWLTAPVQPQSFERPTYREPLPIVGGKVAVGALVAALWMLLFALLSGGVRGYLWLSLSAGFAVAVGAAVLAKFGDRGVAVGAAVAAAFGVSVAMLVLILRAFAGEWLLW